MIASGSIGVLVMALLSHRVAMVSSGAMQNRLFRLVAAHACSNIYLVLIATYSVFHFDTC